MAESIDSYDVEQETGLSYEQRWQIIQHFTEWIKHGDSKIQTLLLAQCIVLATYGLSVSEVLSRQNAWNFFTIIFSSIFAVIVLASFWYGIRALQPYTKAYGGKNDSQNVFFYGSYANAKKISELETLSKDRKLKYLEEQISVLGFVAMNKFVNVNRLQWIVFSSIISLISVVVSFSVVR